MSGIVRQTVHGIEPLAGRLRGTVKDRQTRVAFSHVNRTAPEKADKIDYREVLPEVQFNLFAKLRTLRKEVSEKEGLPAYALFTNEQLAEMVRQAATTLTALKRIKGIGGARVMKYGALFLPILVEHYGKTPTDLFERADAAHQNSPR